MASCIQQMGVCGRVGWHEMAKEREARGGCKTCHALILSSYLHGQPSSAVHAVGDKSADASARLSCSQEHDSLLPKVLLLARTPKSC
jgi:hypothetical protein